MASFWEDLMQLRECDPRPGLHTGDAALHVLSCPGGHGREYRVVVVVNPPSHLDGWAAWIRREVAAARCRGCGVPAPTVTLKVATWLPAAGLDVFLAWDGGRLRMALHSPGAWIRRLDDDDPLLEELAPAAACRAVLGPTSSERSEAGDGGLLDGLADVVARFPDYGPALRELARAERASGRFHAAREHAERAVGSAPTDPEGWFVLADVLDEMHEGDGALFACACCLALDRGHVEALTLEGTILARVGRVADAESRYRRATMLEPGHPAALHNLSLLLVGRGDDEGALELLEGVDGRFDATLRGPLCKTVCALGRRFVGAERLELALRACRVATRIDDDCASAWFLTATCNAGLGRWHEALSAARRTVSLSPTWPGAGEMLERCRRQIC
jgi:Flp pilus assembly protein TadD